MPVEKLNKYNGIYNRKISSIMLNDKVLELINSAILVKYHLGQPFAECWIYHCEQNQTISQISWSWQMSEEDDH